MPQRVLPARGQPWYLLEKTSGALYVLSYEGRSVRLRSVATPTSDTRLEDAVRWNSGYLFATSRGFHVYDAASESWRPAKLGVDGSRVDTLSRDGRGRLWLAGAGLWLLPNGSTRARDLSSLPMLRGVRAVEVIADPHRQGGVIVSLGDRGLLYVSTR